MRPHFLSLTHLCYSCSFYTLIYQNHRNKTDGPNKDLEPLLYLHDIKPHYQALYCNMYIRRYFLVSHIQRMIRTSRPRRSVFIRSLRTALKNYSCRAFYIFLYPAVFAVPVLLLARREYRALYSLQNTNRIE